MDLLDAVRLLSVRYGSVSDGGELVPVHFPRGVVPLVMGEFPGPEIDDANGEDAPEQAGAETGLVPGVPLTQALHSTIPQRPVLP